MLLLLCLLWKLAFRRMNALNKERESWGKGAAGEKSVAHTLSKFPDGFRVVNDVPTPFGNLDHVVIGPTGVFAIETKNWRGIIGADGKGELTWNGKPLKTAYVSKFVGRMMGTKERVAVLAPGVDPFFKAVMVFTSAWVDADFGTTGWVHCVRDDNLSKYIVENKPAKGLSRGEVDAVAHAFSSLARMDPDFGARADVVADAKKVSGGVCALAEPVRA
jgi:hypothetical protein